MPVIEHLPLYATCAVVWLLGAAFWVLFFMGAFKNQRHSDGEK